MIEDNKKEENEKEEDNKIEDDKIEDKIEKKGENDKLDNKNDIKRCCLRCKNNKGCYRCTNKQYKCASCLYFDYIENLRKREQRQIEIEIHPKEKYIFPRYPLFPPDPYQDIELRSFHSVERENNQIIIDHEKKPMNHHH